MTTITLADIRHYIPFLSDVPEDFWPHYLAAQSA